jgi:hypothetical protein
MGIRKDLKKYIKRLNDKHYDWLYADGVIKNLEEILKCNEKKTKEKENEKKTKKKEYNLEELAKTVRAIRTDLERHN